MELHPPHVYCPAGRGLFTPLTKYYAFIRQCLRAENPEYAEAGYRHDNDGNNNTYHT